MNSIGDNRIKEEEIGGWGECLGEEIYYTKTDRKMHKWKLGTTSACFTDVCGVQFRATQPFAEARRKGRGCLKPLVYNQYYHSEM